LGCCVRSGITARRALWNIASVAPTCPSAGRWKPFPSTARLSALEYRIRRANLPERWSLETFPFDRQPGVSRKQIRTFAELDFLAKAENIIFIGPTAVGKSGLATGLVLKALENGYRCQFIRAQDLFDEMYASLADRSSRRLVKRLARLDILYIDELGYLNLKPEQTNIFFKLMEER